MHIKPKKKITVNYLHLIFLFFVVEIIRWHDDYSCHYPMSFAKASCTDLIRLVNSSPQPNFGRICASLYLSLTRLTGLRLSLVVGSRFPNI